jgi:hypothetical protein
MSFPSPAADLNGGGSAAWQAGDGPGVTKALRRSVQHDGDAAAEALTGAGDQRGSCRELIALATCWSWTSGPVGGTGARDRHAAGQRRLAPIVRRDQ